MGLFVMTWWLVERDCRYLTLKLPLEMFRPEAILRVHSGFSNLDKYLLTRCPQAPGRLFVPAEINRDAETLEPVPACWNLRMQGDPAVPVGARKDVQFQAIIGCQPGNDAVS